MYIIKLNPLIFFYCEIILYALVATDNAKL